MGTKIGWTEETVNVMSGCTKCSPGCTNCYAERMALRLQKMHPKKYANGFGVTLHPGELDKLKRWRKPRMVFICSMGDLFHEEVPDEYLREVFATMALTPHTYQVLTKRPERMAKFSKTISWPRNVWAGTTIEDNSHVHRADFLRTIDAPVRFISAEPLLGPLPELNLDGISWLIAGGESGSGWRPMAADWVRDLRDRCLKEGAAFYFKQWAAFRPSRLGNELDGQAWEQKPSSHRGEDFSADVASSLPGGVTDRDVQEVVRVVRRAAYVHAEAVRDGAVRECEAGKLRQQRLNFSQDSGGRGNQQSHMWWRGWSALQEAGADLPTVAIQGRWLAPYRRRRIAEWEQPVLKRVNDLVDRVRAGVMEALIDEGFSNNFESAEGAAFGREFLRALAGWDYPTVVRILEDSEALRVGLASAWGLTDDELTAMRSVDPGEWQRAVVNAQVCDRYFDKVRTA